MTSDLLLHNLLIWGIQTVVLLAVASLFPALVRLNTPSARLLYWQVALLACLAFPAIRPWEQHMAETEAIAPGAGVRLVLPPHVSHADSLPAVSDLILWVLLLGVAIRLVLIAAGFVRLGKYRRGAQPLEPLSSWAAEAELLVSDEIGSPVTFGLRRPVVLLPADFTSLPATARDAVLCHEILHIRRRDWVFTVFEELVRAVFWFHPGIWWTLGEIQLAREQTVDRAVIDMIQSRDEYVDALLTIAGASPHLDVAPAPLFLRKRHLKQRVVSILKEVRMSQRRTLSTLAAGLTLLAGSCWLITGALPLQGAPQTVADADGVIVQTNGAQLMHRGGVSYPREALARRVEGNVVAQVKTDASGNVVDASILSGPDELRKSVLQSVLGWHFATDSAQTTRQILIGFTLPKDTALLPPAGVPVPAGAVHAQIVSGGPISPEPAPAPSLTIKSINVIGLSDEMREQLRQALPVHEGDTITMQNFGKVVMAVRAVDEHLTTSMNGPRSETTLTIRTPETPITPNIPMPVSQAVAKPGQIRVGGQVQAANLINQVRPEYPPLAKQARVQGTVRFDATIGKDGSVVNLGVISGLPLLVEAAVQAVQQWQYKPTLLNGQPVEVLTTIDVNFTLVP